MKKVCIVIPIYKDTLDIISRVSLKSLDEHIDDRYDIYYICPKDIQKDEYVDVLKTKTHVSFVTFEDKYFKNTASYSQLLINPMFYKTFAGYEYMLIFQPDCYMIHDDIEYWCDKGYDYIGAPIFENHYVWKTAPTTGNGGLSLRKISKFIEITDFENNEMLAKYKEILKPEDVEIEDNWFCEQLYSVYDFKKARINVAIDFAIDMNPENAGNKLPMGLHAYDKNINWWKDRIPELNNQELIDFCRNKYAGTIMEKYMKLYEQS